MTRESTQAVVNRQLGKRIREVSKRLGPSRPAESFKATLGESATERRRVRVTVELVDSPEP